MKKIAIITGDISMGGTGKSLIAFINKCLVDYEAKWIDVYTFSCEGNLMQLISNDVNVYEISSKFKGIKNRRIRRIIEMIYSLEFYYSIKGRIKRKLFRGACTVNSIMRDSQLYSIKHSKVYERINKEYDVAISWTELLPMYFLANKVKSKMKLAWIHPNYNEACFDKNIDSPYFKGFDFIVTVSNFNKKTLAERFPIYKDKILTVYNIFDEEKIIKDSLEKIEEESLFKNNTFKFVTVCRIHDQSKAIFRMIEICKSLKSRGFKFTWYIIGDGPDKDIAKKRILENDLQDYVYLLGEKNNPYKYVRKSNLFVLQSYYEGKPMAVDEALILGKPVLVTNYVSALEQVVNNKNGIIVENNKVDILNKLSKILDNPLLISQIENNIKQKQIKGKDDIFQIEKLIRMK
ncbi:glycosyltransferase [Bacillus benzoevorans]|uniref:Glycosyltransferase involved in cell wall biosynthesis n=1 Tax=Bacillus benzoevorans TaxID=1456 RepID=A0A7X0HVC3_9BACI|nr:glycosyltransferase [Bacillus benzoevorans]MBB6447577.1 glycosyltransferase involved in cell wall biosynthesis [Bacillus benzoevorans]